MCQGVEGAVPIHVPGADPEVRHMGPFIAAKSARLKPGGDIVEIGHWRVRYLWPAVLGT
jgi:hypothetical protein